MSKAIEKFSYEEVTKGFFDKRFKDSVEALKNSLIKEGCNINDFVFYESKEKCKCGCDGYLIKAIRKKK
jgi:hypothetical protein